MNKVEGSKGEEWTKQSSHVMNKIEGNEGEEYSDQKSRVMNKMEGKSERSEQYGGMKEKERWTT